MNKLALLAAIGALMIPRLASYAVGQPSPDDELQHVYDTLRSKLNPAEKQVLKNLELRWLKEVDGLTGDASESAGREHIAFLRHWLDIVDPSRPALKPELSTVTVKKAEPVATPSSVTADQLAAPKGEPGTGTIHKGAIIADTPDDREKALDLMYQGDEQSFMDLARDGKVIVVKADTQAYVDEVEPFDGLVKVHFRGATDLPYYVDISDFTMVHP
jgi:hypothetical protein